MDLNKGLSYITAIANQSAAFKESIQKFNSPIKQNQAIETNDFDVVWRSLSEMTTENMMNLYFIKHRKNSESSEGTNAIDRKFFDILSQFVLANMPNQVNGLSLNDPKKFEQFAKQFGSYEIYVFNMALRGINEKPVIAAITDAGASSNSSGSTTAKISVAIKPENDGVDINELIANANQLYNAKDYISSMSQWNRIIIKQPENSYAFSKRALCKIALNDVIAACQDLEIAKQKGDASADSYIVKYCK